MKVFISYSGRDEDKVDILQNEIHKKGHTAIIVERKKNPQQLLTRIVEDSIEESDMVVPILSRKSMDTQWINQEIGLAIGKEKPVVPIVEQQCIGELRGFIHNQIQLPYNYSKSTEKSEENLSFKDICTQLVEDIMGKRATAVPRKPLSELNLEALKQINEDEKFQRKRKFNLRSSEYVAKAVDAFFDEMGDYAEKQFNLWGEEVGTRYPTEISKQSPLGIIVKIKDWSIRFRLHLARLSGLANFESVSYS